MLANLLTLEGTAKDLKAAIQNNSLQEKPKQNKIVGPNSERKVQRKESDVPEAFKIAKKAKFN